MARFVIDAAKITDSETFHTEFARVLKFFDGYGRNMNAWIDCMTDFHGESSLSGYHLPAGEDIELVLRDAENFRIRCPKIAIDLFECTACANRRYLEWNQQERIVLIPE